MYNCNLPNCKDKQIAKSTISTVKGDPDVTFHLVLTVFFFYLQLLFAIFGVRDFLPSNELIRWLADKVCTEKEWESFCSDIIFVVCGFDKAQLNEVS